MIGKILGWIGIVTFGLFAVYGLFTTGMVAVALAGTPFFDKVAPVKNTFWKFLQFLLSFGNFAIYTALAFFVYAGMYDIDVRQYLR